MLSPTLLLASPTQLPTPLPSSPVAPFVHPPLPPAPASGLVTEASPSRSSRWRDCRRIPRLVVKWEGRSGLGRQVGPQRGWPPSPVRRHPTPDGGWLVPSTPIFEGGRPRKEDLKGFVKVPQVRHLGNGGPGAARGRRVDAPRPRVQQRVRVQDLGAQYPSEEGEEIQKFWG